MKKMGSCAALMSTLVVGDGNFTFCLALLAGGRCVPSLLTATSYDSFDVLMSKYGETARNAVGELCHAGCRVVHSIDALRLGDFRAELGLGKDFAGFERIVFNNPLIEGCEKVAKEIHDGGDYIIQNRTPKTIDPEPQTLKRAWTRPPQPTPNSRS